MIGWRAKVGVMVPCKNSTMEPEFYRMAPEGVSFHFDRLGIISGGEGQTYQAEEKRLKGYTEESIACARNFSLMRADAIAFGCTSGSLITSSHYDQEIIQKIQEVTKIPTTTTSTAVIEGLKEMKIEKVVVVTPYSPEVNKKVKSFLEAHGVRVLQIKSISNVNVRAEIVPERVYRLAREIDTPDAMGIFISCTALRSIEIIDILEQDTKKPVISSNQATFWKLMRMIGISSSIKRYGRLLELL